MMVLYLVTFMLFCLFWGHRGRWSGLFPVSILRDHFWQICGSKWGVNDRTWVSRVQEMQLMYYISNTGYSLFFKELIIDSLESSRTSINVSSEDQGDTYWKMPALGIWGKSLSQEYSPSIIRGVYNKWKTSWKVVFDLFSLCMQLLIDWRSP